MKENKYLKWLSSSTESIYWHDSANINELDIAIGNGAVGVTTNPFLINQTLRSNPDFWARENVAVDPKLKGDAKVEMLMRGVTTYIADRVSPFQGEYGKGYCCAQTNPKLPADVDYMVGQAKRYAEWAPNIVVKMPATRMGIRAYEECAALGFNVAATVSFTVPQVLAVGAAYQRGIERARAKGIAPGLGIAVLMVGRLDDYLRDVMNDTDNDASEEDVIWAGTAAIKRAYQIFGERGYECTLMPAGCRGYYHVTELAGAKMVMSIAPKIAVQLENITDFSERIAAPVAPGIITRLQTMPEFVKAYEPDGMTESEFMTFGSCNRTLVQFIECGWNPLEAL